jgi:protoporphyrinogen oxidase
MPEGSANRGRVAVLGGGPAGLTAAYLLAGQGRPVTVFEASGQVGGLARTEVRDGYRFDLGGHRFFTKSEEVQALWREVLGDELLLRPRMSRIYWNGRFLDYPLSGRDVISKLGPLELSRSLGSYMAALTRRKGAEENLEQWVSNRFGKRLYRLFFESYTEKVWGVPCTEIRAEWAAQRIRNLSFFSAARAAVAGNGTNGEIRSLITQFHYPRLGPGQMWETMAERIAERGGELRLDTPVERLELGERRVEAVHAGGERIECEDVISSLPLGNVARMTDPAPAKVVLEAAEGLRYRDFLTVALVVDGEDLFPDNWIYVHDPDVRVARIQNYRSWSPAMVPDPDTACVGLEYFCFRGDEMWERPDEELIALATAELTHLGLTDAGRVRGGYVVRVPMAYPMYDTDYAERVGIMRGWLAAGVTNLQQVGRNGLHRYNNSDHSMLTAIRAVENLDGASHDIFAVNAGSAYHEDDEPDEPPYRHPPKPELSGEPVA